jgi:histidinol-phosphatase (PHP family)
MDLDEEQLDREKVVYFDLLQQAARSGVFQIIGHMDLIKRYYRDFMYTCGPLVEQTLKVFAESGVTIEINTSGLPRKEDYSPCYSVLDLASHYGVPVTFGSDAHKPERVGENWGEAVEMMRRAGYKKMRMFRKLQPIDISI